MRVDDSFIRPNPNLNSVVARRYHPLDVFERLAIAEHYDYERVKEGELHMSVTGLSRDHDIALSWEQESEKLSLFLAFDGRVPSGRRDEICRLLSLINERLPGGHFDFWDQNSVLVYRNCHSLRGGAKLLTEQAMDLIATALEAAERGYPALQYVLWAGKSPEDALSSAIMDLAAQY